MLKRANEALGARVNELESGAVLRATQSRLTERDEVRFGMGVHVEHIYMYVQKRYKLTFGNNARSQEPPWSRGIDPFMGQGGRRVLGSPFPRVR